MDPIMLTTGEIRFDIFLGKLSEIVWNSSYRSRGVNTEVGLGGILRVASGGQQIGRVSSRSEQRSW